MDVLQRISNCGVVPVVVLDNKDTAVPTAAAMLTGGIDVMEITFRTAAAPDCIKIVSEQCPDMLVGAGTVISVEQCKQAVALGAKFIVCPGFDETIVRWCVDNHVPVIPGCVTPSEIMKAISYGLNVVKFFPSGVYGGLSAMKNLSAPFGGIKFMPTGGVNDSNLAEYISAPFVHAVGGSWICQKADIAAGNYDKITKRCSQARKLVLGFEVAHIGINCDDAESSMAICEKLNAAFGFEVKEGNSSNFATASIEVMKLNYLGAKGHIAIGTNSISAAVAELESRGFSVNLDTAKYKGNRMVAVYLKESIAGFAIHLLQK